MAAVDLVFVDAKLSFVTRAGAWLSGGYETFNTTDDILAKIGQRVKNGDYIRTIEILGHGQRDKLDIGNDYMMNGGGGIIVMSPGFKLFWHRLSQYLKPSVSKIILNMCEVGAGTGGVRMLNEIARLTGAIVYGAVTSQASAINNPIIWNDPTQYRKAIPPFRGAVSLVDLKKEAPTFTPVG